MRLWNLFRTYVPQHKLFISRSHRDMWREVDAIYDNRFWSGQWLNKNEALKLFPKPSLHTREVIVRVWGSTVGVIHYGFLNTDETITAENYRQEIDEMHRSWALFFRHYSTESVQYSYSTTPGLTSHNWPTKCYTLFPTKHYLTHRTHPTSDQPIITSLNTYTTSWKENKLSIKMMSGTISESSSHPGVQTFM